MKTTVNQCELHQTTQIFAYIVNNQNPLNLSRLTQMVFEMYFFISMKTHFFAVNILVHLQYRWLRPRYDLTLTVEIGG